jgi:hypothetical protein
MACGRSVQHGPSGHTNTLGEPFLLHFAIRQRGSLCVDCSHGYGGPGLPRLSRSNVPLDAGFDSAPAGAWQRPSCFVPHILEGVP